MPLGLRSVKIALIALRVGDRYLLKRGPIGVIAFVQTATKGPCKG